MSTKRKNLSFGEKKKIIDDFKNSNLSKAAFAKNYGIPRTSLNTILASQTTVEETHNEKRKRQRVSPFEKIEEALIIWVKFARSQNVPISTIMLKEKALQIAKELKEPEFAASNGWIERFKSRYDLSFKKICGEAADVDNDVIEECKQSLLCDLCKRFKPSDIFNIDECGLFYRVLPDKTLSFRNEKCVGGKKSKERLTVCLTTNMDGSEKLTPLVIGKFAKPRCFKNVKSLPVSYEANKKSWMTSSIWEKLIKRYDRHFSRLNRRVVFVADNCPAHCTISNLQSIELVFLPPNVTSVIQPLDQGVIQNLKLNYRKLLLKDMITAIDSKKEFHVSVLDAIFYIDKSWSMVSPKCISNCFRHAGFKCSPENEEISNDENEVEDELPLSELAQLLRSRGCFIPDEMEYGIIDDNVATNSEATIPEIVSQVVNSTEAGPESDEGESSEEYEEPIVTKAEAITALKVVRRFFINNQIDNEYFKTLNKLENYVEIIKPKEKQSIITDFFK